MNCVQYYVIEYAGCNGSGFESIGLKGKKFEGHGWFGTRFDPYGSNPVSNLISRLDRK